MGSICTCGEPILPGQPWDLGHLPGQNGYFGPQHRKCNRATRKPRRQSRQW